MKRIGIAIVGCGTVGGAVVRQLVADRKELARRSGIDVEISAIVDLDSERMAELPVPAERRHKSLEPVLSDAQTDLVVELVGGTGFAHTVIAQAIGAGKDVVTANKALLAHNGVELLALARSAGRSVGFEASCGGGIPLIRTLYDGLISNSIAAIYGIVNGTCNYILTEMTASGASYDTALAEAQRAGLAEADPTLDVNGSDSAHKIAIMAAMAFGVRFPFDSIPIEGIDQLDTMDVGFADQLGYVQKLLAIAERNGSEISVGVRPCFVTRDHPLAWVSGAFNAVSIYGSRTGHTMYYGRGAGGSPTAAAIVADIVSIANGSYARQMAAVSCWPDQGAEIDLAAPGERRSRFYLRMMVEDRPGQLGAIMTILGEQQISVASVLQHEAPDTEAEVLTVPVVVITHRAAEREIQTAVNRIAELDHVHGQPISIAIVDEPENEFPPPTEQ